MPTRWRIALVIDLVCVIGFTAVGRASHSEDVLLGLARTALPFVAALLLGWLVTRAWRAPFSPVRTGISVWAITLVAGMLLRWVSGQGIALPFILVATGVTGLLLIGWRIVATIVRRARHSRARA